MSLRRSLCILSVVLAHWGLASAEDVIREQYHRLLQSMPMQTVSPRAENPTDEIVFPQIANGVDGGLRIITTFALTSSEADPFSVTLLFRDASGNPLPLSIFDSATGLQVGSGSIIFFTIQPFQTVFLETSGTGTLVSGWATARSSSSNFLMGGVASFQLLDAFSGQFLTTVGVGATAATVAFFIPILKDDFRDSNTAIAISNNSDTTLFLELFLFGNDGSSAHDRLSIMPRARISLFINELFSGIPNQFFGTLHFIRVDQFGEALARFDAHPVSLILSNGILSSIPVTNLFPQ